MKVHSNGAWGAYAEFVYIDEEGFLYTACTIGFVPDAYGLSEVPEYQIRLSEDNINITTDDPDILFECLGEL